MYRGIAGGLVAGGLGSPASSTKGMPESLSYPQANTRGTRRSDAPSAMACALTSLNCPSISTVVGWLYAVTNTLVPSPRIIRPTSSSSTSRRMPPHPGSPRRTRTSIVRPGPAVRSVTVGLGGRSARGGRAGDSAESGMDSLTREPSRLGASQRRSTSTEPGQRPARRDTRRGDGCRPCDSVHAGRVQADLKVAHDLAT